MPRKLTYHYRGSITGRVACAASRNEDYDQGSVPAGMFSFGMMMPKKGDKKKEKKDPPLVVIQPTPTPDPIGPAPNLASRIKDLERKLRDAEARANRAEQKVRSLENRLNNRPIQEDKREPPENHALPWGDPLVIDGSPRGWPPLRRNADPPYFQNRGKRVGGITRYY